MINAFRAFWIGDVICLRFQPFFLFLCGYLRFDEVTLPLLFGLTPRVHSVNLWCTLCQIELLLLNIKYNLMTQWSHSLSLVILSATYYLQVFILGNVHGGYQRSLSVIRIISILFLVLYIYNIFASYALTWISIPNMCVPLSHIYLPCI